MYVKDEVIKSFYHLLINLYGFMGGLFERLNCGFLQNSFALFDKSLCGTLMGGILFFGIYLLVVTLLNYFCLIILWFI